MEYVYYIYSMLTVHYMLRKSEIIHQPLKIENCSRYLVLSVCSHQSQDG